MQHLPPQLIIQTTTSAMSSKKWSRIALQTRCQKVSEHVHDDEQKDDDERDAGRLFRRFIELNVPRITRDTLRTTTTLPTTSTFHVAGKKKRVSHAQFLRFEKTARSAADDEPRGRKRHAHDIEDDEGSSTPPVGLMAVHLAHLLKVMSR